MTKMVVLTSMVFFINILYLWFSSRNLQWAIIVSSWELIEFKENVKDRFFFAFKKHNENGKTHLKNGRKANYMYQFLLDNEPLLCVFTVLDCVLQRLMTRSTLSQTLKTRVFVSSIHVSTE